LIDNLDDTLANGELIIERIFMDTDFKDRTVFKLITDSELEPLLNNSMPKSLIDDLWMGKESQVCDGKVTDYSMLSFMASSGVK